MINYKDEEREEVLRPLKQVVKDRKPKSNHKHEYEEKLYTNPDIWRAVSVRKMVCKICGKVK